MQFGTSQESRISGVFALLSIGLPEPYCLGGGKVRIDTGAHIGNLMDVDFLLHARLLIELALDFIIRLYMHN